MSQLPPGLAGQVHDGPPVKPLPAATVLLIRGSEPWEVLMLRRPGGADFAPGANVFPGGSVHADDRLLGDPLRGAAVRELFEELGILLARGARGFADEADAERIRLRVAHGVSFPTALKEAHLEPALEELHPAGSPRSNCGGGSTPVSTWPGCPKARRSTPSLARWRPGPG